MWSGVKQAHPIDDPCIGVAGNDEMGARIEDSVGGIQPQRTVTHLDPLHLHRPVLLHQQATL